jgi:alpha-1,6-mannosyltransferase
MRLCDLTHAYTDTSGGIRTFLDAKRRYVVEHTDWEHTLIIPGAEDSVERDGRLTTIRIASPVIPGAAPYRLFVRPDKVRRALHAARPDVLELTSLYTSPWSAFWYRREAARLRRRCAVTAWYFTDLPTAYIEPAMRKLLGPAFAQWAKRRAEWYVRVLFGQADFVFTSSPEHHALLRRLSVRAPILNMSLGVDLRLFTPERRSEEVRQRFGAGPESLLLAYCGRLDSEKDVLTLVGALERLPAHLDARLVLAGEGPHRTALAERARLLAERDGTQRLFVLPYVADKVELATLLASADVYVTAGPHETFGLSVVEAQAAGLPVVGVRAGALVDRVPEGIGLLGPVSDPAAMAANVERVAARRGEMGEAALAMVRETLSWEASFRTIFEAYESLLARPVAPPLPVAA